MFLLVRRAIIHSIVSTIGQLSPKTNMSASSYLLVYVRLWELQFCCMVFDSFIQKHTKVWLIFSWLCEPRGNVLVFFKSWTCPQQLQHCKVRPAPLLKLNLQNRFADGLTLLRWNSSRLTYLSITLTCCQRKAKVNFYNLVCRLSCFHKMLLKVQPVLNFICF